MGHLTIGLLTLSLTLWSAIAQAAVAIDGTASTNKAFSAPVTTSHNGGTGQNRLTIACVGVETSGGASNTAATYAGVSMTEWGRQSSDSKEAVLWYLPNSATGSNTLATTVINLSAEQALGVLTFTGVNQVTPVRSATTANGTGTAISVAATSVTGDLVVDCAIAKQVDGDVGALTASVSGGGQSQAWQTRSDFYILDLGSTTVAATTSTTMSWTMNQSQPWSSIAGALIPTVSTARRKVGGLWLGK